MSKQKQKVVNKTLKELLDYLDKDLSQQERILVFNKLNQSLNIFPIDDVVKFRQDGAFLINGKQLTLEQFQNFRQAIDALKNNFAFQIIADQILYKAIAIGIHQGLSPDQIIYSKSCIWFIQQFKDLLEKFDTLN